MSDFLNLGRQKLPRDGAWPIAKAWPGTSRKSSKNKARGNLQRALGSPEEIVGNFAGRQPVFLCEVEKRAPARDWQLKSRPQDSARCRASCIRSPLRINSEGFKAFHETKRKDFLQANAISAFSFVELANA